VVGALAVLVGIGVDGVGGTGGAKVVGHICD